MSMGEKNWGQIIGTGEEWIRSNIEMKPEVCESLRQLYNLLPSRVEYKKSTDSTARRNFMTDKTGRVRILPTIKKHRRQPMAGDLDRMHRDNDKINFNRSTVHSAFTSVGISLEVDKLLIFKEDALSLLRFFGEELSGGGASMEESGGASGKMKYTPNKRRSVRKKRRSTPNKRRSTRKKRRSRSSGTNRRKRRTRRTRRKNKKGRSERPRSAPVSYKDFDGLGPAVSHHHQLNKQEQDRVRETVRQRNEEEKQAIAEAKARQR